MKILAVGAHPDDIEIFMFGILSIYKERGDEVFLVIATDGGDGTVIKKNNIVQTRKKEAETGLKKLGKPIFLNFQDGKLYLANKAINDIKNLILKIKPDLVITHSEVDYHPDHRTLSSFVQKASGFLCPVIFCDTLLGKKFAPKFYVDITRYFKDKCRAILAHQSQSPEKFVDMVKIVNKFRAAQCNAPKSNFAEAYSYCNTFPFTDIRSLLPQGPKVRPYYQNNTDSLI